MDVHDEIELALERCEILANQLTDMQFSLLRTMMREKSLDHNALEKKLGRAKRAVDKAAVILRDAGKESDESECES